MSRAEISRWRGSISVNVDADIYLSDIFEELSTEELLEELKTRKDFTPEKLEASGTPEDAANALIMHFWRDDDRKRLLEAFQLAIK